MEDPDSAACRAAAFSWLQEQLATGEDTLARTSLERGFPYGENVVRLSRSGWRNPVPVARGTLQRVQYRIEEEDLIREYWLVMDYPLGVEPRSEVVLEDVAEIEIEYLDETSQWSTQWPPLRQGLAATFVYPRAVRINLELADWGEIVRIVDLLE